MTPTLVRIRRVLVLAALLAASPAAGQTSSEPTADDLFEDSVVHEMRLVVNSRDWAALKENFTENTYYPANLTWRNQTVRSVGIRSRGLGSRSGTKPGLRVDFDRYAVEQTFLGLKSLVLDNLTQDPSMLRERVTMQLFRRLGIPAPREVHVRLYVNDEYAGVYAAVEAIDKTFLGRVLGADDRGNVENDGYLFEYDWMREYRFEYLGDDVSAYAMFDVKTRERDAASEIWGPIEQMVQAINETPDALFEQEVSAYLDLAQVAAYLAAENFVAELDGLLGYAGLNNFYFYRFERSTRSRFLPWDKDNTFSAADMPIFQGVAENVLARRLLSLPAYEAAYLDALLAAAASADEPPADAVEEPRPGWLEREILRQYDQVRAAALADALKPFDNAGFEAAVAELVAFARARSAFVRAQVGERRAVLR